MKRIVFLLICLACVAGGFALRSVVDSGAVAEFLRENGPIIGIVMLSGLLVLICGAWAGYAYVRRLARKALKADTNLTEAEIVTSLVDQFTTPEGVANPTPEDRRRAGLINLGLWLVRRQALQFSFNATVTVVGGLVGAATLFLLYEQNLKLDAQNTKIDEQNRKITLQTDANITESVLLEGTRRAALASDMAALFADIRTAPSTKDPENPEHRCRPDGPRYDFSFDCWEIDATNEIRRFHLSADLKARVTSFSQRNTAYRLATSNPGELDFEAPLRDQFVFQNLSPERGQLFEVLVRNRIYTGGFFFWQAQLTGADLQDRDMSWAQLNQADLAHSNLEGANLFRSVLTDADLEAADLKGANLSYANLGQAILQAANLSSANLQATQMERASLQNSKLIGADLEAANLFGADLRDADLRSANMLGINLANADLRGADLRGAVLTNDSDYVSSLVGATLAGVDLSYVNLSFTDLSRAIFDGANMNNANLTGAGLQGASFADAWAWHDRPPIGLPEEISIALCQWPEHWDDDGLLSSVIRRSTKPENCTGTSTTDNDDLFSESRPIAAD